MLEDTKNGCVADKLVASYLTLSINCENKRQFTTYVSPEWRAFMMSYFGLIAEYPIYPIYPIYPTTQTTAFVAAGSTP